MEKDDQYKEGENFMNRNIALSIVLSVVTCGLYSIYWSVVLTDEVNREKREYAADLSGIVCFLLSLVTCNLFGIYWAYKIGEKLDTIKAERGIMTGRDSNVLYLILELLGFNVIVLAMAQNEMNKLHPFY